MSDSGSGSNIGGKAVNAAVHAVNIVKNSVEIAANIVAQNYPGAVINGVQLLPYVIAILVFSILVPIIVFLALPAIVIENFSTTLEPQTTVTTSFVQNGVFEVYGGKMEHLNGLVLDLEDSFNSGLLDTLLERNYSRFESPRELEIVRTVRSKGVMVDILWFAALHSVYIGNEPANITAEGTAKFIAGMFAYQVSERITDVIEAARDKPLTLLITRTLDIEFRTPFGIMQYLEFDEQQIQWATFMHSVISGRGDAQHGEPIANWLDNVRSEFGYRSDPFTGETQFHSGIDISRPTGTAILAAESGIVTRADWYGRYGNTVIVDHGNGLQTLYAHCSVIYVHEGQEVVQGEVIAAVGSTGRSTGPHLHFEVRENGRAVNPRIYLE